MTKEFDAKKAAEKGYTKEDWDAVSDNPPITAEEAENMRPAREVLPPAFFSELEEARKARGRPPKDVTKQSVTIRLKPETVEKFKATGRGWQSRISDILDAAKP